MRPLLAALLALALLQPAPPLPVVASLRGDGLRVAWGDVPGATLACVGRVGGPLLGCGVSPWHQGSSIDAGLRVGAGETVEVRVWRGLEEVGRGRAVVRWVSYLPTTGTKKPPSG